jgi:hypothetical protein
VVQGKGGVGKTLVASLLAQALQEKGEPVLCLDADPVNASLTEISALNVEPVDLFADGSDEADLHALDAMMERLLTEPSHVVIDNGAASFVPLSRYLLQDGVASTIAEAGKRLVIHTIVAGGVELPQTARGFDSIAEQFPPSVELVLWLNPYHGRVAGVDGLAFQETPVFKKYAQRLTGVVVLPRLDRQFGKSVGLMLGRRMTFAEADKSDLFIMDKQRLRQIKRPIWEQIEAVL